MPATSRQYRHEAEESPAALDRARAIACPYCGAAGGRWCRKLVDGEGWKQGFHVERLRKAANEVFCEMLTDYDRRIAQRKSERQAWEAEWHRQNPEN